MENNIQRHILAIFNQCKYFTLTKKYTEKIIIAKKKSFKSNFLISFLNYDYFIWEKFW